MAITMYTTVSWAFESSAAAPSIFPAHGVRPEVSCRLCWDAISLREAERHCGLTGITRLVERLNRAAAAEGGDTGLSPGSRS